MKRVFAVALAYAPAASSFLFSLLILPLLARNSGPESWGKISIIFAVSAFATLLDFGASQILPGISHSYSSGKRRQQIVRYRLLAEISGLTVGISSAAYLQQQGLESGSALIGGAWVGLMLVNVYHSYIMIGEQKNAMYARVSLSVTALRSALIIAVLMATTPTPLECVMAYFVAALVERITYIYLYRPRAVFRLNIRSVAKVLDRTAWSGALITIAGGLAAQMDRLVLISRLPHVEFGDYLLISTFGLLVLSLQYPAIRYFASRFRFDSLYQTAQGRLFFLAFMGFLVVYWFLSPKLFLLWVGRPVSEDLDIAIKLFSLGVCIQSIANVFYQAILQSGNRRTAVHVGLLSVAVAYGAALVVPADVRAGGLIWIAFSSVQLGFYVCVLLGRLRANYAN